MNFIRGLNPFGMGMQQMQNFNLISAKLCLLGHKQHWDIGVNSTKSMSLLLWYYYDRKQQKSHKMVYNVYVMYITVMFIS